MSVVVHPESKHLLDAVVRDAPHALLLSGPVGIGLSSVARELTSHSTAELLTVLPEKNEQVDLEKGVITVESIRRLYDVTRSIAPNGRTVIIDYAERMAPASQNAFLKLLEEPIEGTQFILLTHQPEILLPTIVSRTRRIDLRPITKKQSEELLDTLKVHDSTLRTQLLFIAEGLPAELCRLAENDELFTARAGIVKDARSLVTGTPYEKLLIAKKYKDTRPDALILLEDAMKLLRRTIAQNGDATSLKALSRYEAIHKRVTEQGNVRLQLSSTVMV